MNTEQLLSVLAILRAYATCDADGIEVLIKDAPATGYADLLAFALMIIEHSTGSAAVDYLDAMANGVLAMHLDEMSRAN